VRYVFPTRIGAEARGVPTAWGVEPLSGLLDEGAGPVWPHAAGTARGPSLTPIHRCAVDASLKGDRRLWRLLAIVDAIRVGDARVRGIAASEIRDALRGVTSGDR
jgi:hypothetical protein